MGHYMIPHHVSQEIEVRIVGQSDLLLPGGWPTIPDAAPFKITWSYNL